MTGLVAGSLLRVQFGSDPEAGDLDLELFDPLGRRVASGSNGAGPERLSAVTRMHGDFELVATRVGQGGPPTAYEVEVEVDPVGSDCASDALEPRGAGGGERLLGPGAWERLSVCPGVDDVYVVSASAGEPLEVRLDFAHDEGNVDLLLLDPSGRQLASSTSRSDDESISWLADRTGLHVLRVVLEEDSGAMPGNVYALDLGPLPSRTCPAEHFEPNDTFTSGTRLIDGLYPGLAVCFREPDYYRLNSAIPGPLEVDVSFEPDGGQVVVRLLDEDGSVLVEASRAPDGAKLRYQTTRRGPYFLEVTLAVDTGVGTGRQYELDVQVPDEDG